MKIITAWIDDPTLRGVVEPPVLYVEVDHFPDMTYDWIHTDDDWQHAKYGPFVAFEREHTLDYSAGDYNVRFAGEFPPVVDITLVVGSATWTEMFALPITRARQLVRKHCNAWRLYLSDKNAQAGEMLWVPQAINPTCRHWYENSHKSKGVCCGRPDTTFVRHKGIDLPLCPEHLTQHNNKNAEARRTTSK